MSLIVCAANCWTVLLKKQIFAQLNTCSENMVGIYLAYLYEFMVPVMINAHSTPYTQT